MARGLEVVDVTTPEFNKRAARVALGGLWRELGDKEIVCLLSLFSMSAVKLQRPHATHAIAEFATREDAAAAISDLDGSERSRWSQLPLPLPMAGAEVRARRSRCVLARSR